MQQSGVPHSNEITSFNDFYEHSIDKYSRFASHGNELSLLRFEIMQTVYEGGNCARASLCDFSSSDIVITEENNSTYVIPFEAAPYNQDSFGGGLKKYYPNYKQTLTNSANIPLLLNSYSESGYLANNTAALILQSSYTFHYKYIISA